MKKQQEGTALFVVVLLFMAIMLVPAVSAYKQVYTATIEVPSNFRVYNSIEQGNTATVEAPSNFRVYSKEGIKPAKIKESINAGFTISFKGTEQKFGHKIYFKDGEEIHEMVPYVPHTYIKVIGDSNIDDFPASISVDKVDNVPGHFVEITESDLDKYTILRNILEELERTDGDGIIYKTGEIKGQEIINLVQCKYAKKYDAPQRGGPYIKYKEDFYSIGLMIA
ncbi:MAG: hypothetical protein WAV32_04105 [Halobacteriota archaeon]